MSDILKGSEIEGKRNITSCLNRQGKSFTSRHIVSNNVPFLPTVYRSSIFAAAKKNLSGTAMNIECVHGGHVGGAKQ